MANHHPRGWSRLSPLLPPRRAQLDYGGRRQRQTRRGQGAITQGLIGLAILAASYVIIKFIETAIGMNLLNISWPTAGQIYGNRII